MINVTGRALPTMKKAGWGRIVNVSSVLGVTGYPGDSIYSATKSSMFGFSKALARECARYGITVNVVAPGFIETDMNYQVPDEVRAKILKTIPIRRWGEPHEVADMVAFLVEKGEYVTGHLFTVDGGYTI
jgi:3-oxoacyl-[acyl-carrier protein] reductase